MTSLAKEIVDRSFNQVTAPLYWHYAMKHCHSEKGYAVGPLLDARIQQIAAKLGTHSFERIEEHGLTPLHVGTIVGNRAGIQFLFEKNVNPNSRDQFGKRPVDYAQQYHPELVDLFCFPHRRTTELASIVEPVLRQYFIPLLPMKGAYQKNSDEFGRELKQLIIGKSILAGNHTLGNSRILRDLKVVLGKLGIQYKDSEDLCHIRDSWVRTHTGEILKPSVSLEHTHTAVQRAQSHALYFNQKAFTRTTNPFFKNCIGQTSTNQIFLRLAGKDPNMKEFQGDVIKQAPFYFEGGNVLILTNRQGQPKALIGRDHRVTTLNIHRLQRSLEGGIPASYREEMLQQLTAGLTSQKIKKVSEYLFSQGSIKQDGRSGFLSLDQITQVLQVKDAPFRETAEKLGLIPRFQWSQSTQESYRPMVARYQLQKYISHKLTSQALHLTPEDVHYVSQAAYHLDTFLKPGPNRSIFVQDYQFCADLLQSILKAADELQLSPKDKLYLQRYLATAEKLESELGPLLKKVRQELQKADFDLISIPGSFMYESDDERTYNVNFINALSGWSSETKKYYYITTGAQVGDHLGPILMDLFDQFLKRYVPEIETYFIGRAPQNNEDFSEPMSWWNSRSGQAGVHCFTFDLDAKDHSPGKI